jgi:hypothetical protein
MNSTKSSDVKFVYYIFLFAVIISFLYSVITGQLNGDYLGYEFNLSFLILSIICLISILPFYFLYRFHNKIVSKTEFKKNRVIDFNLFYYFLLVLLSLNILFTLLFGLGIMTKDAYNAPAQIKWFIQILNRISYIYGTLLYLISCKKNDFKQIQLILLLLILAYLRAGMGVIFYIIMIYSVKYKSEIIISLKKYKSIVLIMLFFIPTSISFLYEIRNSLRDEITHEVSNPITGMLFGRLSSFSNTAIIIDNPAYFLVTSKQFNIDFYQKQGLGGVIGQDFMPVKRPENIMYELFNQNENQNISYMTGVPGILILSFFVSPIMFVINLLTIIFLVRITYFFFKKINLENSTSLAFILLSYVLMSGVSNELFYVAFTGFVYYILILLFFNENRIHSSKNS